MKTRITELFGIEHPILCGGMHRLCVPKLCAAVSNAGGLGSLTASTYPEKKDFVKAIREVRKLTDKPFWCNVTMLPAVHLGEENYKNYFDAIIEENVPAVEISGMPVDRLANGEYLDRLLEAGVKLVHKVGSVRHAKHAEKVGYSAVIAAGVEEGGHPLNENVATTVLTPRIAESVKIPVIATGGMADGRGLAIDSQNFWATFFWGLLYLGDFRGEWGFSLGFFLFLPSFSLFFFEVKAFFPLT
ncbi:MAG: nitronate monooxygenase, partial [Candidatus Freyarchaeota archaeon]|nr:nitronate monooxygenase [Candidatus Jordarchaeia archaeon]